MAIALGVTCLAPLMITDVPPVLDYPNHLARLEILAFASRDPVLSRIYKADWHIVPNLGIDLLAPTMLMILPIHVVGRVLLGFSLLLPGIGVVAYSRALFRQRLFWPLASGLIVSNTLFLLGFINFLLSVGVALIVAAGWTYWRERYTWRSALLCSAGAVIAFFCHLGGLLFLLILVASAEVERLSVRRRLGVSIAILVRDEIPVAAIFLPTIPLYYFSPFATASTGIDRGTLTWKLCGLFASVIGYNVAFSLLVAFAVVLFVALCVRTHHWDAPLRSKIGMLILVLAYAGAPFSAKGAVWIDARFSVMAAFLLFAGFTPRRLPSAIATSATVAFTMLFIVNGAIIASNWSKSAVDLRQYRAATASITPGMRVLVVRVSPQVHAAYWDGAARRRRLLGVTTESHIPGLLVVEHHAFWPLLFSTPSQQPVTVLPPYLELAVRGGMPPDYTVLFDKRIAEAGLPDAPYLAHWRQRFDAILVLDADGAPELDRRLPEGLTMLTNTGFAALIRVDAAHGHGSEN